MIDRKPRTLARTLVGPGLPVWSVAFLPDSRTLLTGGADSMIRRWNAMTGEPVDPIRWRRRRRSARRLCRRSRSRNLSRLCRLSHAVRGPGQQARARRSPAFSAGASPPHPGYNFSKALKRLDIVWTPETVSRLFEIGPRPIRPAPRCRSSASVRSRIAPRWCNSSSGRRSDRAARRGDYQCFAGTEKTNDMSSKSSIGSLVTPAAAGDFFDNDSLWSRWNARRK